MDVVSLVRYPRFLTVMFHIGVEIRKGIEMSRILVGFTNPWGITVLKWVSFWLNFERQLPDLGVYPVKDTLG